MNAALRSAVVAIVATLSSFGVTYAICTRLGVNASPAILAAALTVGLMRAPERLDARSLLLKLVALPLVALGAGIVGYAFLTLPALGAVTFSAGIAASVALRKYGARASEIGRTIALPLIAILVVPVRVDNTHGTLISALLVIVAGVSAFACSALFTWAAEKVRLVAADAPRRARASRTPREGQLHVSTRMALQMLVALGLAFAIGMVVFPAHWPWVVLTAFIVCSGAVGRGDAIYKGLLRFGGAIGGTLVAAIVSHVHFPSPISYAAIVFFVLFAGIALRQISYAYWAACATLIFALLQGSQGIDPAPLFAIRVLCIAIGALCAVAAVWFVYPTRTEQVVRRRIADALGALREVLAGSPDDPGHAAKLAALDLHALELRRVAPPVRLHRAVFGATRSAEHPATLIDLTHALLKEAKTPGFDRAHAGARMRHLRSKLQGRGAVSAPDGERRKMRVHVSVAVSIDGYIDDRSDERLILSSPEDLADMRVARAECDAILVGAGTVRRDNPSLQSSNAVRVTVTKSGDLDPAARFFDGDVRTIVLAGRDRAEELQSRLHQRAQVVPVDAFDAPSIVAALENQDVRSLFVEGGTRVLTSFLSTGTFDRLRLAIAPFFVGDARAPRLVDAGRFLNDKNHRLILNGVRMLGDVAVLDYERPRG